MNAIHIPGYDVALLRMPWRVVRHDGVVLAGVGDEAAARRIARVMSGGIVGYARAVRR